MRPSKPPIDPLQFVEARHDASREVCDALDRALKRAPIAERHELRALSTRIKHCNSTDNCWIAKGATNTKTGELYTATGRFWRCGSKLCPDCIGRQARRTRQKLRYAVERQKLDPGERWYFVTFTIVNPSLSLKKTRALVDRAWSLFRKRLLCVSLIRGGSKSEEFTVTAKGFHYHLHCLFLARKWMSFQEYRRVWTECVQVAYDEEEMKLDVANADGLLRVVCKTVNPGPKAYYELCKYITKSDSWRKIPQSELVELALVRRWFRMFELFGCLRPCTETPAKPALPIVHTRSFNDGSAPSHFTYWRDEVREFNVDVYELILWGQFEKAKTRRRKQLTQRWYWAEISTLYDEREKGTTTLFYDHYADKQGVENST